MFQTNHAIQNVRIGCGADYEDLTELENLNYSSKQTISPYYNYQKSRSFRNVVFEIFIYF